MKYLFKLVLIFFLVISFGCNKDEANNNPKPTTTPADNKGPGRGKGTALATPTTTPSVSIGDKSSNKTKSVQEGHPRADTGTPETLEIDISSLKEIGRGAFGTVYDYSKSIPDTVIKIALKEDKNKNLLIEYKNLVSLQSSQAVPKTHGLFKLKDGRIAYVMEAGEESVDAAIGRGRSFTNEQLETAIENMIKLKTELEASNIKYTDIKPANLLIMKDNSIKAIDIDEASSPAYLGTYGEKMAKALIEAKAGRTPLFYFSLPTNRSKGYLEYEKYRARAMYKKLSPVSTDVASINSLSNLLEKLKFDKWRDLFERKDYSQGITDLDDELKFVKSCNEGTVDPDEKQYCNDTLRQLQNDFSSSQIAFKGDAKTVLKSEQKEVFLEVLNEIFKNDSKLKQMFIDLYNT